MSDLARANGAGPYIATPLSQNLNPEPQRHGGRRQNEASDENARRPGHRRWIGTMEFSPPGRQRSENDHRLRLSLRRRWARWLFHSCQVHTGRWIWIASALAGARKMESLEDYFESFMAAFPQLDPARKKQLQGAFHAGAMAVCTMLSRVDSEHYPAIIKELQQEEHAFGKKEL
jgi:hypothetical protein